MQTKKAARVFPEPVGAEINVGWLARMLGQPCSWGSVGVPNFFNEPLGGDRVRPGEGGGNFYFARKCGGPGACGYCSADIRGLFAYGAAHLHLAGAYVGFGGGLIVFVEVGGDGFIEGAAGGEDEVDGVAAGAVTAGVGRWCSGRRP